MQMIFSMLIHHVYFISKFQLILMKIAAFLMKYLLPLYVSTKSEKNKTFNFKSFAYFINTLNTIIHNQRYILS